MKILVGLYRDKDNEPYMMSIAETDEISSEVKYSKWEDLDIEKLNQCANIHINAENFKNNIQNPKEYINAEFDIERLINLGRNENDFQITNVYYDEFKQPQLYRTVGTNGYVSIHDISELEYRKESNVLGKTLEQLPSFVKKEPLSSAYEWWNAKDEAGKKSENSFLSSQFQTYEDMPVRILYHYLIGVMGFKEGYHTATEIKEDYSQEIQHEYMLFKDTAIIKLTERVAAKPETFSPYSIGEFVATQGVVNRYPEKRRIGYYGATMSMICTTENYPALDICSSVGFSSSSNYDKDGIAVDIDLRKNFSIYNKLQESECISKNWRIGAHNRLFDINSLLPRELALLSEKLQSQKENVPSNLAIYNMHSDWSPFKTANWIKIVGLALSVQFYNPELREKLQPIFNEYQKLFVTGLSELIENMGAKDALEVMKWTKENAKIVLQDISLVKEDGSLQKASVSVVDEMNNLFTYRRNDCSFPEWLQIYSPETIRALGGVTLLQRAIDLKGEEEAKEIISILAEGIETERRSQLLRERKHFLKDDEILSDNNSLEKINYAEQTSGVKKS